MSTITTFLSEKLLIKNLSNDNLIERKENFLENYNRVLIKEKNLPSGFQIRQFPMSSCEDTFVESDKNNDYKKSVNSTLKRYYHVFKANELDTLVREAVNDELKIYKSYYDHGNWCVCAQKK